MLCILSLILGNSCSVKKYAVSPNGRLIDSIYTYRNDSLGICFYFGSFRTQYGFIPLDKYASKLLSYSEINPKSDTILFAGTGFFCINRHSTPSYLKTSSLPEEKRAYREYPLIDDSDNITFKRYVGERGLLLKMDDLKRLYTTEQIDSLRKVCFIRKVRVFQNQQLVIIEDLLPYQDHYISMIYIIKECKEISKLHSWKGGSVFYDPTSPDRLMSRSKGWYYDFDLIVTRENGRRLVLGVDLDSLCRLKDYINY